MGFLVLGFAVVANLSCCRDFALRSSFLPEQIWNLSGQATKTNLPKMGLSHPRFKSNILAFALQRKSVKKAKNLTAFKHFDFSTYVRQVN